MDRESLEALCREGLSLRKIAARMGVSQSTVRHHLRKFGLKTRRGPRGRTPRDLQKPYKCSRCGSTDPESFYGHKRSVCGPCHNAYNLERGRQTRRRVLEHLGGRCVSCGFDRYSSALDVHHLDPTKKDTGFSTMRYWSWKRLLKELAACVLLCKNCHAAVHAGELVLDAESESPRIGADGE